MNSLTASASTYTDTVDAIRRDYRATTCKTASHSLGSPCQEIRGALSAGTFLGSSGQLQQETEVQLNTSQVLDVEKMLSLFERKTFLEVERVWAYRDGDKKNSEFDLLIDWQAMQRVWFQEDARVSPVAWKLDLGGGVGTETPEEEPVVPVVPSVPVPPTIITGAPVADSGSTLADHDTKITEGISQAGGSQVCEIPGATAAATTPPSGTSSSTTPATGNNTSGGTTASGTSSSSTSTQASGTTNPSSTLPAGGGVGAMRPKQEWCKPSDVFCIRVRFEEGERSLLTYKSTTIKDQLEAIASRITDMSRKDLGLKKTTRTFLAPGTYELNIAGLITFPIFVIHKPIFYPSSLRLDPVELEVLKRRNSTLFSQSDDEVVRSTIERSYGLAIDMDSIITDLQTQSAKVTDQSKQMSDLQALGIIRQRGRERENDAVRSLMQLFTSFSKVINDNPEGSHDACDDELMSASSLVDLGRCMVKIQSVGPCI